MHIDDDHQSMNAHETMVEDSFGHNHRYECQTSMYQRFYDMLDAVQRPVWLGSHMSELEAAVRLVSIKSNYNVSHNCFSEFTGLMKEACPPGNALPSKFSKVKKVVWKLGLTAEKIGYCPNGCMLYYRDDLGLRECKLCHHMRYKTNRSKKVKGKRFHKRG